MTWTEAGVLAAVASTVWLILKELYTTFVVNRKKDKHALQVAKAEQPEIMRQLELGNFKAAAEGISIAQTFVNEQLTNARADLERLRKREADLETANTEKDDKIDALEGRCFKLEGKVEALESMLKECQKKLR
jgi:peptidoglycan hydrolase CwlO-like protein